MDATVYALAFNVCVQNYQSFFSHFNHEAYNPKAILPF